MKISPALPTITKPPLASTTPANALASFSQLTAHDFAKCTNIPNGLTVSAVRTQRTIAGQRVTLLLPTGAAGQFNKLTSAKSFYVQVGEGFTAQYFGPFAIQSLVK